MVQYDLNIIRRYIEQDIKDCGYNKEFNFEYEFDDESLQITAATDLGNLDDMYIIITANKGGGCSMSVVFNKVDETTKSLEILNSFNLNNSYFKAYIADNGYLVIKHFYITHDEESYTDCVGEFLYRAKKLPDDNDVQKLYSLSYVE